jgi:hypothetical protein
VAYMPFSFCWVVACWDAEDWKNRWGGAVSG